MTPRSIRTDQRVVTATPLTELWNECGTLGDARSVEAIGAEKIKDLLRGSPVQFIVANVGERLTWVALKDCFLFWRHEVAARLAEPDAKVCLEDFPGDYAYIASRWFAGDHPRIVVLYMHH